MPDAVVHVRPGVVGHRRSRVPDHLYFTPAQVDAVGEEGILPQCSRVCQALYHSHAEPSLRVALVSCVLGDMDVDTETTLIPDSGAVPQRFRGESEGRAA